MFVRRRSLTPPPPPKSRRATKRPRFTDEDADTLKHVEGSWLVKGLWPRQGLCFVAGPSMSGKSFWVIDQTSRIAKGEPVLGRRSVRAGVVYVAAEGANGVRARFEGLREKVGLWDDMIRVISDAPNLSNEEDVDALGEKLREIKRRFESRGSRLGMVIIDTLSAAIPGVDENSAADMSPILTTLQELAVDLDACIVVVAHLGKDAQRGIRGWSGLLANADGVIFIGVPTAEGTRIGDVHKVKDGEAGGKFAFGLEVVDLGPDADGDPVSTCVVDEREVSETSNARPAKKLDQQAQEILKAYDRLADEMQEVPAFPGVTGGTKGLKISALRRMTYDLGFHVEARPDGGDDAAMGRWEGARKKAFQRALLKLVEAKTLRKEGDYVWAV